MAKVYVKAGRKWWEAIVPIYNVYVLQKIVGRPGWWTVLYFIPFVNIVVGIVNSVDLAKAFGKGLGTALGLIFVPFIMYPVMAFGSSYKYGGGGIAGASSAVSGAQSASPSAEAVTNVPSAGVAVGAGVGAAQPGEAISQTNPVPKNEPVNSAQDVSAESKQPEESEPQETPTVEQDEQPESSEQQPAEEKPAEEQLEEPTTPPETPEQTTPTDDTTGQTPGAPSL